jgi:hypothetical protein
MTPQSDTDMFNHLGDPQLLTREQVRHVADAIDFLFAQRQGHCPNELYEDGYSDACADAKAVVAKLVAPKRSTGNDIEKM